METLKMKTKLKRGQYVKIYQKPQTHEDYEGVGQIKKIYPGGQYNEDGYQLEVSFRDDVGPFTRWVYEPIEVVKGWTA